MSVNTHLIVVLAGHDVGERDLSLKHFSAVHELHEKVADRLKLHLLCWLYIRQNQARENLDYKRKEMERNLFFPSFT